MGAFIASRLLSAGVVLLGVSVLAFLMIAAVPGSAAEVLLGTSASPERVESLTQELGLDQPLPIRFLYWLEHAVRGDLGDSILSQQPVTSLLGDALVATAELSLFALVLAIAIAFPLGLLLGADRDRWWARVAMPLVSLGLSVPGYVIGLLLILLFSVELGWLPAGGYVAFTVDPAANLEAMILPTITLAFWIAPGLVRFLRAATVGVMREDFVAAARAKGVGHWRLLSRHVAPNAAIPALTYLGLQLGLLIGGALVVEVVFSIPGMGRLGLNAILDRDYPVVQGVVVVLAVGYVLLNLLVDLCYGLIDPRVRVQ
jgi:peptide/nickel transport system permease protein